MSIQINEHLRISLNRGSGTQARPSQTKGAQSLVERLKERLIRERHLESSPHKEEILNYLLYGITPDPEE